MEYTKLGGEFAATEGQARVKDPVNRRLLRNHTPLMQWLQMASHLVAIFGVLYLVSAPTTIGFDSDYRLLGLLALVTFGVVGQVVGFYRRFATGLMGLWRVAEVWLCTCLLLAVLTAATGTFERFDPAVLFTYFVTCYAVHVIIYHAFRLVAYVWQKQLDINIRSVVIGTGPLAQRLVEHINRNSFLPDRVVGVIGDNSGEEVWTAKNKVPLIGDLANLDTVLDNIVFDRLYIALPVGRSPEIQELQTRLLGRITDVIWVPDVLSMDLLNPGVREVGGMPLISLSESPLRTGAAPFFKSLLDVAFAIILLVLLSPLLIITSIGIKLTSPGPIFYKQKRHGWDGGIFEIWKFRSMADHETKDGVVEQARPDDKRITKIGKFIRSTSIDELPQLFNVLNGTMSLVGPRPHALEHNNKYSAELSSYMLRHRIKPGMSGWAQIHGHRGLTDTLKKMQDRLEHDLYYINNWSFWLDIKILALTPICLLKYKVH